jgi:uncharacterized phage protein gp47/JayE
MVFDDPFYSYEAILERALERGRQKGIDVTEGSIFFDAVAPMAAEHAQAYAKMQEIVDLMFPDTSNGIYLEMLTKEEGVYRNPATKTVRHMVATGNGTIHEGDRFLVGDVYFVAAEGGTAPVTVRIESEEAGSSTVVPLSSSILPLQTIPGIETLALVAHEEDANGMDEESDESLLDRYLFAAQNTPASGNVDDYIKWAREVPGVGICIVVPLWAGRDTVKLIILDQNGQPASPQLLQDVKTYIDPTNGYGGGKAPIGAVVTVVAAKAKTITVAATVEVSGTKSLSDIKTDFEAVVKAHLSSLEMGTGAEVRMNKIGALLMGIEGVQDYSNLKVNDGTVDVSLADDEVPVLGAVTLQ